MNGVRGQASHVVFDFTPGTLRVIRTTSTRQNRNDYDQLGSKKASTRNRREGAWPSDSQSWDLAFLTPGNAWSPMHSIDMSKSDCAAQTCFANGKKHDQVKHLRLCISHWTKRPDQYKLRISELLNQRQRSRTDTFTCANLVSIQFNPVLPVCLRYYYC